MLRIAFVDHHLNNYHANKFVTLLRGPLADLGAEVACAFETDPRGEDWCAKQGVRACPSLAEAVDAADAIIVLAPDNIEAHPVLCSQVLPSGKPCFVDKFLATGPAEAAAIAALASKHGAPLFSASSLRFAVELDGVVPPGQLAEAAYARGMGTWDVYGCHTVSLLLAMMGCEASRVIDTGSEGARLVTVDFEGRRGLVEVREAGNMFEACPWSFGGRWDGRYSGATVTEFDGFYANLMRQVIAFFRTGTSPLTTAEMLLVPTLLAAAELSLARGGSWINLG